MTEDSNNAVSNSFLLDDDSRLVTTFNYGMIFSFWDRFSSIISFYIMTRLYLLRCSIPFSVDDLSKSMEQIDISDVEPPPLIRENTGFTFLLPRSD